MAEEFTWAAKSGSAPLPVPKRPPIRPVGVQPVGLLTGALIAATVLQAVAVGWGAWMFEQMRRDEAAAVAPATDGRDDESESRVDEAMHRDLIMSEEDLRFEEELEASLGHKRRQAIFFGVAALVHGLEVVAFLFWQIQVHANLAALGSVGMRYGSGTSVVWWFVPIAVLWKPLGVLQEIWKGSDPSVAVGDEAGWRLKRPSFLATMWWSLIVAAKFLYWFSAFMYFGDLFTIVSPIEMWIIALATTFAADGLQVVMVRRIAVRQMTLERKRLAAVAKAEGAGQAVVEIEELTKRAKPKPAEVSIGAGFEPQFVGDAAADGPTSDVCDAAAEAESVSHGEAAAALVGEPATDGPSAAAAPSDSNAADDKSDATP